MESIGGSLFDRSDTQDKRPAALAEFQALLPEEDAADRLNVLANTPSWDREIDQLIDEIVACARRADADVPVGVLTQLLLSTPEVPAAYAIGRAIRLLKTDFNNGVARLDPLAGTANGEALIGFLHTLVNEGDVEAFDRYLDDAYDLPPIVTLQYSVRGDRTTAAARRVDRLVQRVTVVDAARVLFAWMHDADQAESARYLRDWESRIATQADYNAAIDFAAMQVFRKSEPLPDLDLVIADLVPRRLEFPEVGQQRWDWAVLARRQLESDPFAGAVRSDVSPSLLIAVVVGMGQAMDIWLVSQQPGEHHLPALIGTLTGMIRGAVAPEWEG